VRKRVVKHNWIEAKSVVWMCRCSGFFWHSAVQVSTKVPNVLEIKVHIIVFFNRYLDHFILIEIVLDENLLDLFNLYLGHYLVFDFSSSLSIEQLFIILFQYLESTSKLEVHLKIGIPIHKKWQEEGGEDAAERQDSEQFPGCLFYENHLFDV
jgi:hypothetical protein